MDDEDIPTWEPPRDTKIDDAVPRVMRIFGGMPK
jgi:hypothetical protein